MKLRITIPFLLLAPQILYGQGAGGLAAGDGSGGPLGTFLRAASNFIFGPVLVFILALAFIVFAWGVLKYFIADAEGDKSAAKSLMFWGILGFVLIVILFGIVNLIAESTGLGGQGIESIL